MQIVKEVPRLKPSQAFRGTDYADCINTGKRPYIFRPGKYGAKGYLVYREIDREEAVAFFYWRLSETEGKQSFEVKDTKGNVIGYWYRVRGNAVSKFLDWQQDINRYNVTLEETEREYRQAVKRGDIATALRLG